MNLPGRDRHVSWADVCIIPFPVVRCKLSSMNAAKYSWHCTKTVDKYSYNSHRSDGVLPSQQSHLGAVWRLCHCCHWSSMWNRPHMQYLLFCNSLNSEWCFLALIKLYTWCILGDIISQLSHLPVMFSNNSVPIQKLVTRFKQL